jgi:pyrimidine-nucleoside phosphorylase
LIPGSIIQKKKVGSPVAKDEFDFLVKGFLDGSIPDYQMSAFLMAICFKGMSDEEIFNMTDIMLNSGVKAEFEALPGFKVDKHSTGGVGDKVSLILAPIVAACGLYVPMISGRSLGITGGTLDKLESIPGFRTRLELKEFESIVAKTGLCLAGQTEKLVPGDKRIYALRDVTATIDSIPLICASILSKKVAEGIDALVFDIKVGSGAFMRDVAQAELLGEKLSSIASMFGKKSSFLLSDMNSPLGYAVGNWLEVVESVHCLRGLDVPDLMEVTYQLAGMMLSMGGKSKNIESGIVIAKEVIKSGRAYEKFLEMVEIQGGDISYIENLEKQNMPKHSISVEATSSGYLSAINAYNIGMAGIDLGVGRKFSSDEVDPLSGIVFKKVIGDEVSEGDDLAIIYSNRDIDLKYIREFIGSSFVISNKRVERQTKIISIEGNCQ